MEVYLLLGVALSLTSFKAGDMRVEDTFIEGVAGFISVSNWSAKLTSWQDGITCPF